MTTNLEKDYINSVTPVALEYQPDNEELAIVKALEAMPDRLLKKARPVLSEETISTNKLISYLWKHYG